MAKEQLTISQKQEWAKLLYTKEGLSQKEIAERVGTTTVSMSKWVKKFGWDQIKQSMLVTRDTQLSRLYAQLDELNTHIMSREPGARFAVKGEGDTIAKYTAAIRALETEASLSDIIEVSKRILIWLRPISPDKALEIARIFDDFIKDLLKQ